MAALVPLLGLSAGATGVLSTIAAVAPTVFGVMGAIGQVQAGKAQQQEYNRQAREERVAANIQSARMRREARLMQSRDRALMLEGGALSGTAFGVLKQNAAIQELDALTVTYQGEQQAQTSEARGRASRVSPLTIFSAAVSGLSKIDPLNIGGQI